MATYEDILFQARKTAKHLRRLEDMMEDINACFSLDDLGALAMGSALGELADEIEDDTAFLAQFKEREFRVKVFMADEYEVTVRALNEDQAIEKVVSNPADYAHEFESTQMVDKTDNVLSSYPYEPTAEEKV